MVRRLGIGLLKGLLVGAGVGALLQVGLHLAPVAGLLGYLLAMGTGATAGVIAGKPAWRVDSWIETLLKAVFGLGIGALLYWIASSLAAVGVPFELPSAVAGTPWTGQPLLFSPAIGAVYGSLVELDNTEDDGTTRGRSRKSPRARVDPSLMELDLDDAEEIDIPGLPKRRKR